MIQVGSRIKNAFCSHVCAHEFVPSAANAKASMKRHWISAHGQDNLYIGDISAKNVYFPFPCKHANLSSLFWML